MLADEAGSVIGEAGHLLAGLADATDRSSGAQSTPASVPDVLRGPFGL
jgi:hypothetical protein